MAEISETIVKDQQQQAGTPLPGKSGNKNLQRYALRSVTKSKEEKELVAEMANSSSSTTITTTASKRSRPLSSMSKSVGVLDLSGKDKSAAKPPRRLSNPPKSNASPASKLAGNITPISEARAMRSGNSQNRNESSPFSEFSRSTSRKKLDILSYASYWISQIKLSETAAKHSISLGFFKLALESGCKPLQRLREELKSYSRRHDLTEHVGSMKKLFESYGISEMADQLQVSEDYFQVPEEATRSSDDEVHSSSSTVETKKLKPKSLNTDAAAAVNTTTQVSPATESSMKRGNQRNGNNNNNTNSAAKVRGSWNKNPVAKSPAVETARQKAVKKPHKLSKVESNKDKEEIKKQGKESICAKVIPSPQDTLQSNKENLDVFEVEEISTAEVM